VNAKPAAVTSLCSSLRLDAAQLHGDETPAAVAEVAATIRVLKAFRVGPDFSLATSTPTRTPSRFSSMPPMQANMVVLGKPPTGPSLSAPRSPPVLFWQAVSRSRMSPRPSVWFVLSPLMSPAE